MRNLLKCSAVLLFSLSLFAQTAAKPASRPAAQAAPAAVAGGPTVEVAEAYFKRMFGYDSNIQVKVPSITASAIPDLFDVVAVFLTPEGQQIAHFYVSRDMKHAIAGELLSFGADPFLQDRQELARSAFGPSRGPANAKLLLVEFADLECPSCKEAQPVMRKLHDDFPEARFVFQSFPLDQLHPWAIPAASYLDCIARSNQAQAFTFIDSVYSHQKDIEADVRKTGLTGKVSIDKAALTEHMRSYTEASGADPAAMQACAEAPATLERVLRSQTLAKTLGVTGTPTLFVNGRRIDSRGLGQYEALKNVISFEAELAEKGK